MNMSCAIDKKSDSNWNFETRGEINQTNTPVTLNRHYFCHLISVITDLTGNSVITKLDRGLDNSVTISLLCHSQRVPQAHTQTELQCTGTRIN